MGPQSARAAREDEHGAAVHHVAPHHRPGGKRVLEVAVSRVMHHDRRRPQGHRSLLLASAVAPASAGPLPAAGRCVDQSPVPREDQRA